MLPRPVAGVDNRNLGKIGRHLGRFEICDVATLPKRVQASGIRIAIVAVPVTAAQSVVDDLVKAGIKAILNYVPITVTVPPSVKVQYIDPVIHLQHMTYYL